MGRKIYNKKGAAIMADSFKSNFKPAEKKMVSLSVYNVGFQKCTPGYQWGPGVRDHFLIHYVVSGKGFYQVNDTTYALYPGDCFLVFPHTEITYYADSAEPWEYYWVGFSGSDAASILKATDFSKNTPVIHGLPMGDAIKAQLLHIYEARGNGLEHSVEMTGRLYTTLALFIKGSSRVPKRTDSYLSYAKKGVEYISLNYSYPITVEDIAAYAGVSRSHLFRAFEEHLSMSPKEYLSDYRIRQACLLLQQSDLSIAAIARSVGYENNLYFSRAFKKAMGMPPSEYARRQKA